MTAFVEGVVLLAPAELPLAVGVDPVLVAIPETPLAVPNDDVVDLGVGFAGLVLLISGVKRSKLSLNVKLSQPLLFSPHRNQERQKKGTSKFYDRYPKCNRMNPLCLQKVFVFSREDFPCVGISIPLFSTLHCRASNNTISQTLPLSVIEVEG